ncbi:MAG: cation diffusion facilitator family transporter [Acidimicrobiia bacterium]
MPDDAPAPQPHGDAHRGAVLAAFFANLAIAVAKFVGFAFTGAASLLAEGIHSVADTANQGLLMFGARRAQREPDESHPFGYGRERYFWAFVVSMVLFTGGGLFALYEGEEKLRHPHELESLGWAVGILAVSMVFEGLSLRTAVRHARPLMAPGESWIGFIRRSKEAELPVVLLEDTGALIGLAFALAGVALAAITGNPRYDAIGSIAIGLLLVAIALMLAVEMKSLLIGEAASRDDLARVRRAIEHDHRVQRVVKLQTSHLGPDELFVGAELEFVHSLSGDEVAAAINDIEDAVRAAVPSANVVYVEPEVAGDAPEPPPSS